ncbi:MAG: type II toxin-antitoxin system VapC family toxin [Terracidiphilus sp.]
MILLDTNVISEAMKLKPDPSVMAWVNGLKPGELWTCTIVVAELFSGLDLMPAGKRQRQLREKAGYMFAALFAGRIYNFDESAARVYGAILKARRAVARPIDEMDALIAAIALANGATLATRNIAHFEQSGVLLVNPWR